MKVLVLDTVFKRLSKGKIPGGTEMASIRFSELFGGTLYTAATDYEVKAGTVFHSAAVPRVEQEDPQQHKKSNWSIRTSELRGLARLHDVALVNVASPESIRLARFLLSEGLPTVCWHHMAFQSSFYYFSMISSMKQFADEGGVNAVVSRTSRLLIEDLVVRKQKYVNVPALSVRKIGDHEFEARSPVDYEVFPFYSSGVEPILDAEKYATIVLRLDPDKNIPNGIAAFSEFVRDFPDYSLRVFVARGEKAHEVDPLIAKYLREPWIDYRENRPQSESAEALSRAAFNIGCGLQESFGLAIAEAGERGTPSVIFLGANGMNGMTWILPPDLYFPYQKPGRKHDPDEIKKQFTRAASCDRIKFSSFFRDNFTPDKARESMGFVLRQAVKAMESRKAGGMGDLFG